MTRLAEVQNRLADTSALLRKYEEAMAANPESREFLRHDIQSLSKLRERLEEEFLQERIDQFWQYIAKTNDALAQDFSSDNPVYDAALSLLQEVHPRLYLVIGRRSDRHELIVTAEGDVSLFPVVDEVVRAAPEIRGWIFFSLKPRRGMPEFVKWNQYRIEISKIFFDPLAIGNLNGLGLRFFVPDLDEKDAEDAHSAILQALDFGLGERAFAESVQHTEIRRLETSGEQLIPLASLEAFIDWRKNRKRA